MGREGRFTGRRAGRRLENGEWSRFELSMCVHVYSGGIGVCLAYPISICGPHWTHGVIESFGVFLGSTGDSRFSTYWDLTL
jgi:hypothetical protein